MPKTGKITPLQHQSQKSSTSLIKLGWSSYRGWHLLLSLRKASPGENSPAYKTLCIKVQSLRCLDCWRTTVREVIWAGSTSDGILLAHLWAETANLETIQLRTTWSHQSQPKTWTSKDNLLPSYRIKNWKHINGKILVKVCDKQIHHQSASNM